MSLEGSNPLIDDGPMLGADSFEIVKLLGVGSQGKVYLVKVVGTDEYFAMKVFKKDQIIQNEKTTDSILTEHRFLATSQHPFITKLFYSFHSMERLFMVMEYCPGGELFTAIKKQPQGRLSEEQVQFYTTEVILVLEYIHSKGYIYRDLKPENILLHIDGHIRMADFGLSKQHEGYQMRLSSVQKRKSIFGKSKVTVEVDPGEVVRTNSLVGSVHYLAPEVLQCTGYDAMADWWALGVLMFDMLYGFPPFSGKTNHEVFTRILGCDYSFPNIPVSSTVRDLIKKLLKLDPKKRLGARHGAQDIKKHPFFTGIHWGLLRNREPPIVPMISSPSDTSNFIVFEDDEEGDFAFFSEIEPEIMLNPGETEIDKRFASFHYHCTEFDQVVNPACEEKAASKEEKKKKKKKKSRKHREESDDDSLLTPRSRKKKKHRKRKKRTTTETSTSTPEDDGPLVPQSPRSPRSTTTSPRSTTTSPRSTTTSPRSPRSPRPGSDPVTPRSEVASPPASARSPREDDDEPTSPRVQEDSRKEDLSIDLGKKATFAEGTVDNEEDQTGEDGKLGPRIPQSAKRIKNAHRGGEI